MIDRVLNTPLITLRGKCPYSEFFWSLFSRIRTEYGEIQSISVFSPNAGKYRPEKLYEYEHFSHSVTFFRNLFSPPKFNSFVNDSPINSFSINMGLKLADIIIETDASKLFFNSINRFTIHYQFRNLSQLQHY